MNFDFSDEQKQLREEARRFLADRCPTTAVRVVLEGPEPYQFLRLCFSGPGQRPALFADPCRTSSRSLEATAPAGVSADPWWW